MQARRGRSSISLCARIHRRPRADVAQPHHAGFRAQHHQASIRGLGVRLPRREACGILAGAPAQSECESVIGHPVAAGLRKRHHILWCNQDAAWRPRCQTGASVPRQSFGKRAGAHARRESKRIRAMGQKREAPSRQARQGAQGFTFWSGLHVPAGPTINGRQMGKAESE